MAYITSTAFEEIKVNTGDWLLRIAGKFFDSTDPEACSAGFIVKTDGMLDLAGYTHLTSVPKSLDAYKVVAAADGADADTLYICNPYGVATVTDPVYGNVYRIGANTLGIPVPADEIGTYTKIEKDFVFAFGAGNFGTAPDSTKKYITIDDGLLEASSTAPDAGDGWYFEYLSTGNFTEGAYNGGYKYIVIAKKA